MHKGLLAIFCLTVFATPLFALPRTFVSTSGSDLNPCSRHSPCRSFGVAIAATDPGGEVVALDSGGYGPFTMTIPVGIEAPAGITASITASSGNAIVVALGVGESASIRGLALTGPDSGSGVVFNSGGNLLLERISASRFSAGIVNSQGGTLTVHDSLLFDNFDGLNAGNASTPIKVTLSGSRVVSNSNFGIASYQYSTLVVADSVISGNGVGIHTQSWTQSISGVTIVESCAVVGNSLGIYASGLGDGDAEIRVSNSTISGNNTGVFADVGAILLSRENNTVTANATDGTFTGTYAPE